LSGLATHVVSDAGDVLGELGVYRALDDRAEREADALTL